MIPDIIILFMIAFAVTLIGAIPLGLVNLTVVDITIKDGSNEALKIAHGAAIIETLFGLTAFYLGSKLSSILSEMTILRYIIAIILVGAGLYFLLKRTKKEKRKTVGTKGVLIGALLNLLSFQVLLYWIVAMGIVVTWNPLNLTAINLIIFSAGIWLAKVGVLWGYVHFSKRVLSTSKYISNNINNIIGAILLVVALVQFFTF